MPRGRPRRALDPRGGGCHASRVVSQDEPQHDAHWEAVDEATELLREGDRDGAMRELRGVLDRDPSNAYAHYFLGVAHFERGEFEAARAAYQSALDRAPGYLGAAVGLGHALRMLDRLDDAQRAGERALAMAGGAAGDPDAHYLLGLVHSQRGEARLALRHLRAFLDSNPELEARHEVDAMIQALEGKVTPLDVV
jgi:tetratricopeptide (TPR) repeat protein